jgi:site-specific DNA recombinase
MKKRTTSQNITKSGHKIGAYIRVSTEEQAENPEGSIKSQEQRIRQFIATRNQEEHFGEIAQVYVDRAKSGKDTNRPELQRLLQDIRSGQITLLIVSDLSRLSRSIKDFCEMWEMMRAHSCEFQSLRERFDTTSAAGEMILYTLINLAQFERRQVAERVTANLQARSARGLYNGGIIPMGYKSIPNKKGYLEPDPEYAPLIREAFQAFLREETLSKTAWKRQSGTGPILAV